jgi:putative redox protein
LLADEPRAAGGQGAGPGPYDLLLSALGACTAITLKMYADRKGWPIGKLRVALTLDRDGEGNTFIVRQLSSDASLDAARWDKLLEIAGKTPVTRTLLAGASITTTRA